MNITVESIYKLYLQSTGISIDSRKVEKGQIFFALKGAHFDGNCFASQAIEKGASWAIIDNQSHKVNEQCILVDNVLNTLQDLSLLHRQYIKSIVIGITGSNGKTTTKELVARVLASNFKTHATSGNYNNHIGLPLTILSSPLDTEFLVVEMGASYPGEIGKLCQIAQPEYGIITNVGKAHLEGFGSYENIFQTKTDLYRWIHKYGKGIIVNRDDDKLYKEALESICIDYGINKGKIRGKVLQSFPHLSCIIYYDNSEFFLSTNLYGGYNIYNVLAAVATGIFFEVPIENIIESISSYKPTNNRSQYIETSKGNKVILDAYNANPSSMKASLEDFCNYAHGQLCIFLGSMLELGNYSDEEHFKILEFLTNINNSYLVCLVGKEFFQFHTLFQQFYFFEDTKKFVQFLKEKNLHNCHIFIKGSRGIAMETALPML